jgi:Uma2 family endonuclease
VAQTTLPQEPADLYQRLLEEDFRVELIDGDVVVHAAPGMLHGFGLAGLSSDLHQAYQRRKGGPGGWWILNEVDNELAPARQAYRPDIVGGRQERMQRIPAERPVKIVPDFVCVGTIESNGTGRLAPFEDVELSMRELFPIDGQ